MLNYSRLSTGGRRQKNFLLFLFCFVFLHKFFFPLLSQTFSFPFLFLTDRGIFFSLLSFVCNSPKNHLDKDDFYFSTGLLMKMTFNEIVEQIQCCASQVCGQLAQLDHTDQHGISEPTMSTRLFYFTILRGKILSRGQVGKAFSFDFQLVQGFERSKAFILLGNG